MKHLNISTVNLGFSLEASPDMLHEVYERQSTESGTLRGVILTPEGLEALVREIGELVSAGLVDRAGRLPHRGPPEPVDEAVVAELAEAISAKRLEALHSLVAGNFNVSRHHGTVITWLERTKLIESVGSGSCLVCDSWVHGRWAATALGRAVAARKEN